MPRRVFCAVAFLFDFLAGYLVLPTQQSKVSYPGLVAAYAVRQQREKHSGKRRENEAGVDCEPLQQALCGGVDSAEHTPGQFQVVW